MNILVFGFRENISAEIVKRLDSTIHKVTLESTIDALNNFARTTNFDKYDFVVGIGSYSGADRDKIRIETVCTSQFRNNKERLTLRRMNPFFVESNEFKFTTRMGNSYCNLVSYLVTTQHPSLKFTFLHVPSDYPRAEAVHAVNEQLRSL